MDQRKDPSPQFTRLVGLVNKLQGICAAMGDNAESSEGESLPGLWDTLPIIVAVGGQARHTAPGYASLQPRRLTPCRRSLRESRA